MVAAEESFRALNYVLCKWKPKFFFATNTDCVSCSSLASAITLMVYDWILSFSDEIKYIWTYVPVDSRGYLGLHFSFA